MSCFLFYYLYFRRGKKLISLLPSFTGGDTGIAISKKAGMVPLQMELGGKDACIVLEDADLDLVAANIVKGGFSYRYGNQIIDCMLLYKAKLHLSCHLI